MQFESGNKDKSQVALTRQRQRQTERKKATDRSSGKKVK